MCSHTKTKVISEKCFSGSVSKNQNPAAHGNVCYTEECLYCGLQRDVNVNQNHVEKGSWKESPDSERIRNQLQLIRSAPPIPEPVMIGSHYAEVDEEGFILTDAPVESILKCKEFFEGAQKYRLWYKQLQDAS
jgi:hypothetical protein